MIAATQAPPTVPFIWVLDLNAISQGPSLQATAPQALLMEELEAADIWEYAQAAIQVHPGVGLIGIMGTCPHPLIQHRRQQHWVEIQTCASGWLDLIENDTLSNFDLMNNLAHQLTRQHLHGGLITTDLRFCQLLREGWQLLDPRRKQIWTPERCWDTWGTLPERLPHAWALTGLPGSPLLPIPGMTPNVAQQLLSEFHDLSTLWKARTTINPPSITSILETHQQTIKQHVKAFELPDCPPTNWIWRSQFHLDTIPAGHNHQATRIDPAPLDGWKPESPVWVVPTFVDPDTKRELHGIRIAWGSGRAPLPSVVRETYWKGPEGLARLQEVCLQSRGPVVAEQWKPLLHLMDRAAWPAMQTIQDMEVGQYLIQMATAGTHHPPDNSPMRNRWSAMHATLATLGLTKLYETVEMPLVPVLVSMEASGLTIDRPQLTTLLNELQQEKHELMMRLQTWMTRPINIQSNRELSSFLFDDLKLPKTRRVKDGWATDEDSLRRIAQLHPIIPVIIATRQLLHAETLCRESLLGHIDPLTGRIHTTLNQCVATTGRLSSSDPNLQNIPVRGALGKRIRDVFVAPAGRALVSGDYSQIEPRILAELSHDDKLTSMFEQGADLHHATAMEIFRCHASEVTPDLRRSAKSVVFGIIYGISPYGLALELNCSEREAEELIARYYNEHPGVDAMMRETITRAQTTGYVQTILGRRRAIPELQSPDAATHASGRRLAVNTRIQGSAADLIKVAMNQTWRRLGTDLPDARLILQVHDELIAESERAEQTTCQTIMEEEMRTAWTRLGCRIPMKLSCGIHPRWSGIGH